MNKQQFHRTVTVYMIAVLLSFPGYAQSKKELTDRLSDIVKRVNQDESNWFSNSVTESRFNADFTGFIFKRNAHAPHRGYDVGKDLKEFNNISWKDLDEVFDIGSTFQFIEVALSFKQPVAYHFEKDYFPKHEGEYGGDVNKNLSVNFLTLYIHGDDFDEFEQICFKLRSLHSGESFIPKARSSTSANQVTVLPQVAYCEKALPPKKMSVISMFHSLYDMKRSEIKGFRYKYEETLFKCAGIDFNSLAAEDVKNYYPEIRKYWNKYSYNFYNDVLGVSVPQPNLLIYGTEYCDHAPFKFLLTKVGANISFLDPIHGRTYLDFIVEEMVSTNLGGWQTKYDEMKEIYEIARKGGVKLAREVLKEYGNDPVKYQELKESIRCNSYGDGFLANLSDDPDKYFDLLNNIGVRRFDDAVIFFETAYNKKLTPAKKNSLKAAPFNKWE